jgi:hypothetical protein
VPGNANSSRKGCIVCGRPMTWRRKWALAWQGVKFCSERCRKLSRQRSDQPNMP